MGSISKSFSLLLILLLAISSLNLLIVRPASAQTAPPSAGIPTPSVPTFTLKFIQSSYNETITNPYTGVNSTQEVNNNTIDVIIKNQQFTPYIDASTNTTVSLWYNVQVKGHFEDTWTVVYQLADYIYPGNLAMPSASEYTVISPPQYDYSAPAGGQVDFQVEAIIGTWLPLLDTPFGSFYYETSGWSSTQTITIPANIPLSPTPAPSSSTSTLTPTPTPTLTSVSSALNSSLLLITTIALVAIVFLLVVIISLLLYMKKRRIA